MPIGQYWEILEELSARKNELASTRKELDLNKKLLARQCDLAREAETETERWKTMVQRHNPSGCCCQINENNGDPQMVEPCAFHAEWRDVELEALREKYYDLILAVSNKYPNETRHETAKRRIMEREQSSPPWKVSTESVTQPRIDFCYACGTALGVE